MAGNMTGNVALVTGASGGMRALVQNPSEARQLPPGAQVVGGAVSGQRLLGAVPAFSGVEAPRKPGDTLFRPTRQES
jgi:hypothetical protein